MLDFKNVFTPRKHEINPNMYVHRYSLEKNLKRWMTEDIHGFLVGESGNGKTWLYKKAFSEENTNYVVANCGLMTNTSTIRSIIEAAIPNNVIYEETGYSESKSAELNAYVAKGAMEHTKNFVKLQPDSLIRSFEALSRNSRDNKSSIVVLENIEALLTNQNALEELCNILLLLDDQVYAKFKIKLLLVGVPSAATRFFSQIRNTESVGNRIKELPRVSGLSDDETNHLIDNGFNKLLGCDFSHRTTAAISRRIFDTTLGVPFQIHTYCLELCYLLEETEWNFESGMFDDAELAWLQTGLRETYSTIEQFFPATSSKGIKEQVLFLIGRVTSHQFDRPQMIESYMKHFPNDDFSTLSQRIGISLSNLSKGSKPLLLKNSFTDCYSVINPKIIMCLRVILKKDENNKIIKKAFAIAR